MKKTGNEAENVEIYQMVNEDRRRSKILIVKRIDIVFNDLDS